MSKKQLLTETEIRRFMKLANVPTLGKKIVTEGDGQMPQDAPDRRPPVRSADEARLKEEELPMDDMAPPAPGGAPELPPGPEMGGEEEVVMGGEVEPEVQAAFEAAVQALADSMGIEVELEGAAGEAGEEGGEEDLGDLDMGGEEEAPEAPMGGEEEAPVGGEEEEEEEVDESAPVPAPVARLSEDELVEAVYARVTARLVAEAKKKKLSVKEKMKLKAKKKKEEKEDKKEKVEEADAKGGGPLLSKGGQKKDVWSGTPDMKMGKGADGGSGGHKMEDLSAKSDNTEGAAGKNLATLGGNKKKV